MQYIRKSIYNIVILIYSRPVLISIIYQPAVMLYITFSPGKTVDDNYEYIMKWARIRIQCCFYAIYLCAVWFWLWKLAGFQTAYTTCPMNLNYHFSAQSFCRLYESSLGGGVRIVP
jgi:hypothetical protein